VLFLTKHQDLICARGPSIDSQVIHFPSNKLSMLSSCLQLTECFALCYSCTHLIFPPPSKSAAVCLNVVSLFGSIPLQFAFCSILVM
jgi:ABC-type uncharacterized transport system permease subunit